ncbi:hypothetical protein E5288_WYG004742 [Bos mutus]|uniref:Uncharacterized protein n=1 Tax=Bos mutus TaxID=72004 RepID=A0A6B0QWI2_9CETA|nr:hypothetical protein [Bos mutus]
MQWLFWGRGLADSESQAGWNQNDPTLIRNKQLCSTCRGVKMVQPKTLIIPDDRKLSFANIMNHRMMSLHQPKAQTVPKRSRDDILTENVHYRLPILGPRTAVFHRLLSDAYETLQETQLSSLPSEQSSESDRRPEMVPGGQHIHQCSPSIKQESELKKGVWYEDERRTACFHMVESLKTDKKYLLRLMPYSFLATEFDSPKLVPNEIEEISFVSHSPLKQEQLILIHRNGAEDGNSSGFPAKLRIEISDRTSRVIFTERS